LYNSHSVMGSRRPWAKDVSNWRSGLARAKAKTAAFDEALAAATASTTVADKVASGERVRLALAELESTVAALEQFRGRPATAADGRPAKAELMDGALLRLAAALAERTTSADRVSSWPPATGAAENSDSAGADGVAGALADIDHALGELVAKVVTSNDHPGIERVAHSVLRRK